MKKRNILALGVLLFVIIYFIHYLAYSRNYENICNTELTKGVTKNIKKNSKIFEKGQFENLSKIKETDQDTFDLAEEQTNVAINYWNEWKTYNKFKNNWNDHNLSSCETNIPGLQHLNFNNIFWQIMQIKGKPEYYLYNAYYDNRGTVKMVRIIASQPSRCLLYFEDKRHPILSEMQKFIRNNSVRGPYQTVLFSCPIPSSIENLIPKAVSLIDSNECPKKVENLLRVIYERPQNRREEFAVCHKSLRFADIDLSLRLIEWLELLSIFGVSKVYFYSLSAHNNMEKVLDYYQRVGFVVWRHSTLPGNQINNKYLYRYYHDTLNTEYWPQERLELNDCFYRNLHKYEFIANFDLDEMVVPNNVQNWSQMIHNIKAKTKKNSEIETFYMQGAKVYSNILSNSEHYSYAMSHLHRTAITIKADKCIHVCNRAKYLATHTSYGCLEGLTCRKVLVYPRNGYFLHYRIGFDYNNSTKNNSVIFDPILTKYKNLLQKRIEFSYNKIFN